MKKLIRPPSIIIFLCVSTAALAAPPKYGTSGAGEAGFASSTGNTPSSTLYASLKLSYLQKMYQLKGLVEAVNKTENSVRTKERYVGDIQGNLYFSDYQKAYGFGQTRWESDRFANIDLNSYYIAGLGYQFFNDSNLMLSGEFGFGYQNQNYTTNSSTADFDQKITKISGKFEYGFNPNVRFLQDLTEYYGDVQANLESNTALRVKLTDNFKMKISYKYRYNTAPAAGKLKEDTETLMTMIYDF